MQKHLDCYRRDCQKGMRRVDSIIFKQAIGIDQSFNVKVALSQREIELFETAIRAYLLVNFQFSQNNILIRVIQHNLLQLNRLSLDLRFFTQRIFLILIALGDSQT